MHHPTQSIPMVEVEAWSMALVSMEDLALGKPQLGAALPSAGPASKLSWFPEQGGGVRSSGIAEPG